MNKLKIIVKTDRKAKNEASKLQMDLEEKMKNYKKLLSLLFVIIKNSRETWCI